MWELKVYNLNAQLIASYNPNSPGGIVGPFRWAQYPTGGTIRLQFGAIPSMSNLPPRSIVHLYWNGEPVAGGVLLRVWPSWDGHVRTYEVASPRYLMETRFVDAPQSTLSVWGFLWYLRQWSNFIIEWPDTSNMQNIPSTAEVSRQSWYSLPISHALTHVLASIGLRWDIVPMAPNGYKLFALRLLSATPTVSTVLYEDGALEASPADFTGIPDVVIVVLSGLDRLQEGVETTGDITFTLKLRIGAVSYGEIHAAFVLANPALDYVACSVYTATGWANPFYAVDGSLSTYASNTSNQNALLRLQHGPAAYYPVGYKAFVEAPQNTTRINGQLVQLTSAGWVRGFNPQVYTYPDFTRSGMIDIYTTAAANAAKVYEVQGMVIWESYLMSIIRSLYAPLYYPDSGTVTFRKYVPPADIITITNGPYSDLAGALESAEYEISVEGGVRTKFQLGRSHDLTRELISRESTALTAINRLTGGRL